MTAADEVKTLSIEGCSHWPREAPPPFDWRHYWSGVSKQKPTAVNMIRYANDNL